jgi:hypothetical protein
LLVGAFQLSVGALSTHLEDELAPEMPPLAQAMRIGSLGETIELDLGSAYRADLKKFSDALEMPARATDGRA